MLIATFTVAPVVNSASTFCAVSLIPSAAKAFTLSRETNITMHRSKDTMRFFIIFAYLR